VSVPEPVRNARERQLRDASAARAADAFARAQRAIISLTARGENITFAAVATRARVSESYLYKQPELRSEIRKRRFDDTLAQPHSDRPRGGQATADSLRTQLSVAASRLRTLEAEVRDLRGENETLRGKVLELRRRTRSRPS
jgi:hypothetical protein